MANKKTTGVLIRKLQQSKGSYYITVPIHLIRRLGWRERQKVIVRPFGAGKLIVEDWKK
ncbi:hypothetical protein HY504_00020 [Candidatus Wolfebacteria bacterium]|nr:hypothetical protein [Candidatus Wolfebacteria bacterium]